jgi:iron complex outermembrane receptor protein
MNFHYTTYPRYHKILKTPIRAGIVLGLLLTPAMAGAQDAQEIEGDASVFELSPFEVSTDRQYGYRAGNSVSGTRTAEAVKNLPFSLQVVTDELISDMKVTDLEDAIRFSPAVQDNRDNLGNYGKFNVRGIQQTYSLRNGFRRYGPNDTSAAAQVELVKGPAGLLYGQVFPGGVVNVITKKPQPIPHYEVEFRYGSYDSYRASADFGGPLNDSKTLNYRLISAYEEWESFVEYYGRKVKVLLPSVSYAPTDWIKFSVDYEYYQRDEDAPHAGMVAANLEDLATAIANPEDPFGIANDFSARDYKYISSNPRVTGILPYLPRSFNTNGPGTFNNYKSDTWTIYTDIKPTDWLSFRSAVVYYDYNKTYYANYTNNTMRSGLDLSARAEYLDSRNKVVQSQNDFLATFNTGPVEHKILFGGEYYSDRYSSRGVREGPGDNASAYYVRLPNPYNVTRDWNVDFKYLNPVADWAPSPRPDDLPELPSWSSRETEGMAFYLTEQAVLMNEQLRILAGARYEEYDTINYNTKQEGSKNETTFQGGFLYQLTETFGIFASYSESFYRNEFYGQNGPSGMVGELAPPQLGDGLDFGIKVFSPDGKLSGTISYYDLSQSNILTTINDENNNAIQRLAGERNSKGVELDFNYAPQLGWQILFNYAYIRATDVDSGMAFPNVPKHQGSIWTRYEFTEGSLEGLFFGGGAVYMGDRPGGNDSNIISQSWEFTAEAYIAVDAFIGKTFRLGDHDLQLQFNVSNLTDEEYIRGGQTLPSEPRRYMVSATYTF